MYRLRRLLFPFGWLYGAIVALRNWCYNIGIFRTHVIEKKSIVVGNLSVGGTGKTPLVEWLITHFIAKNTAITTLSRGYGRTSKGLLHASEESTATTIGDEPAQFYQKFGTKINVVVAEKRLEGIQYIQEKLPNTELIILDDAFQHRAVKAGLTILVTPYDEPYFSDWVLPAGNLREFRSGKRRADIIVVSKCPDDLDENKKAYFLQRLKFPVERVFFAHINYGELVGKSKHDSIDHILLVTGIGNPAPLLNRLRKMAQVEHLRFPDHYRFTAKDIREIHEKFDTFANRNKIIVTTEKDFMRLQEFNLSTDGYPWFYQPIQMKIDNSDTFKALVNEYYNKI